MRKGLWEELSAWIEEKLVAQPEHSLAAFLDRPFPEDDGLLFDVADVEDLSPGAGVAFFVEFEDSDEEPDLWEDASSGKTPKAKPEPDTAGSAPLQAPNAAKPREEPPADRPYKPKIRGKKPQSLHYSVVEKAPRPKAEPAGFDPLRGRVVTEEGFPEAVLRLIGEKNMTDPQCYNRANISRAVFNKLKQSALNPAKHTYRPSKTTALALAVALELSLDETNDLLKKAGFALSRSDKGDVIVEYFLVNRMYDIFEINEALFRFDQPLLGSL